MAKANLKKAFEWADSDREVPKDWEDFARWTFAMKAKTYTPALGTALLARSVDSKVDPLSIKASYSDNAYSLRTLGHEVLVPSAREFGFSIRNTGREPLNNQPFFRYDHMLGIDRPLYKSEHSRFIYGIQRIEELDSEHALGALAAYLRVALEVERETKNYAVKTGEIGLSEILKVVATFLGSTDRPKRTQALVAGAFDVTFSDVRTRRLNDPSRDFPGDIQIYWENKPVIAVEVRAKKVLSTEVESFVAQCRLKDIERAFFEVLWPGHDPLPFEQLRDSALKNHGVLLNIIEREEDLIFDVFGWTDLDTLAAGHRFAESVLKRLKEIEAIPESLEDWVFLIQP